MSGTYAPGSTTGGNPPTGFEGRTLGTSIYQGCTVTTVRASPRGGAYSGRVDYAAAGKRSGFVVANQVSGGGAVSANEWSEFVFDFNFEDATVDCPILFIDNGPVWGRIGLWYDTASGKLGMYESATGKGTIVGSLGSLTLAADTWYRMHFYSRPTNTTGQDDQWVWRLVQTSGLPDQRAPEDGRVVRASPAGGGLPSPMIGRFDPTSTQAGQSLWVDNLARYDNVNSESEEHYVVMLNLPVLANGSSVTFPNVVNLGADTTHLQAIDEEPANTGDYIWVDGGATAYRDLFTCTFPSRPTNFDIPRQLHIFIRHRNQDGGKWAATHNGYAKFASAGKILNGLSGSHLVDPGASFGSVYQSTITDGSGNPLTLAELVGLEYGVDYGGSAGDAARWEITTLGAELVYEHRASLILPRDRSRRPGIRIPRPRGEQRRIAL